MNSAPNILFLFSDQHNPFFMGHAGHPFVVTPHLDRLAATGTGFTNTYTPNPICVPARYAMLSGQYSRDTLVYQNNQIPSADLPSFAQVLSDAGWRTGLIGKAHFTGADQFRGYQERPYGDLRGIGHQADPFRGADPELDGVNGVGHHPAGGTFKQAGPTAIPEFQIAEHIITQESIKWLQIHRETARETPFLLSVQFPKPHFPLRPPKRWFDFYEEKARGQVQLCGIESLRDRPPVHRLAWSNYLGYGATQEELDQALAAYAGSVSYVDECIGHLLDSLEHLGFADDTLVIYSSDHGEMAGAHGLWHKQLFYEESARVPLIFSGPGIPSGQSKHFLSSLLDLFPTFCEVAGLPIPKHMAGTSLMPIIQGEIGAPDRMVFSEIGWRPDWQGCMVRWQNWKYCWYLDGAAELYDLDADPSENVNMETSGQSAAVRDKLHNRLMEFWQPEQQEHRRQRLPHLTHNKGAEIAMQWCLDDGRWVNAWP